MMKTKRILTMLAVMLLMSVCSFAQGKYLYIGSVEPTAENYKTIATEVTSYNDYYEYENNTGQKCNVYVLVAEEISVSMRDPALGWIGQFTTLEFTSADIPGHKVVRTGGRIAKGGRVIIDLGDEWKHFYLGTTQPTAENYETLTPAFSSLPAIDGATVQVPSSGKIYLLVPYSNSPSQSLLKHCFINNEGKTVTYTERNYDGTSIYRHYIWELSFEPGTVLKYNYLTEGFNNQTLYTLTCKHGALVMNAEGTGLAAGQTRTDAPEEDKRFAIITYNGKRYLYSPSVKQYLLADGSFVSRLGSPITFDDSKAEGEYKFMISTPGTNGETWYFNNNNGNIDINSWGTPDDGNRWLIESCVLNIDLSEALALAAEQPVTITAENKSMVYGDNVPTLTFTTTGATLNGTPKLSTTATKTSAVGTYPIKVEKGTVTNTNVTYVDGTLTIGKAPLTIAAGTYTKKQGEALPEFTLSYEGFKNNETKAVLTKQATVSCSATEASAPGEYPVTVSGAEAQNYAISYTNGKLIVVAADAVIVKAKNYTREYGEANPTFEFTTEGAALEGTPEIICEAKATSPVGTYDIIVKQGTVTNYNVTYVNGTLTIGKAPLTVSVGNYSREQGQDNPAFVLTYQGWKNGESESVLLSKPVATTTATKNSAIGDYPITISGGQAQNYKFEYVNGVLTVTASTFISRFFASGKPFDVYAISGKKVRRQATTLEGLPKGIYIIEGRKVTVR